MTTVRQRFQQVLSFEPPEDRLPLVEWAAWWDQTIARWLAEGLDPSCDPAEAGGLSVSLRYFGLDELYLISASTRSSQCPYPASHGAGILDNEADYERLLPCLYPDESIERLLTRARALKPRHDAGEIVVRLWLDGFFWYPRSLFGIENHFYAFHDEPELMQRINEDLCAFHERALDALLPVLVPDMTGFAEDMSYNHGPMISKELFDHFIAPYYRRLAPRIKASGSRLFVDSDGQVHELLPWLIDSGIEGIYPLERQSMVDVAEIRALYPRFLMLGGFDKRVMHRGEQAIRAEFERLLPTMRSGGFIPSIDHQTPPEVSLEDYRLYRRIFGEYAERAVTVEY